MVIGVMKHVPMIVPISNPEATAQALAQLQAGHPIIFPTDTVYGIGAAAFKSAAVERLYEIKQRPRTQPIPVLISDYEDLPIVAQRIPPIAAELARRYWPGALTLVLPASLHLPAVLLANGDTIAVRIPNHPWLRTLIRRLGQPLAATSANRHGEPTPALASDLAVLFEHHVHLVLDDGPALVNIPSTVVDCTGPRLRVIRAGKIHLDEER